MKKLLLLLPVLAILGFSCNSEKPATIPKEITFVHTVFFWLNDSVTMEDRAYFEEGLVELGKVPSIAEYYYGKPAGTDRGVVDNSYDYAWIVHFANAADQDEYQEDPIHLEFIEKYNHLWEEVKVYDTILETGD
ncbi:MAG: Dabb family protein [Bacteroidales bacterium]